MLSVLVEARISQTVGETIEHSVASAMECVCELRARVPNAADEERQRPAGEHWLG